MAFTASAFSGGGLQVLFAVMQATSRRFERCVNGVRRPSGDDAEQPREQILAHADLLGYAGMFGTLNDRGATLNRRNAEMPVGGVDGVFR